MFRNYLRIALRNIRKHTGVLALFIAVLTVSYQAIKAAVADQVDALRYEQFRIMIGKEEDTFYRKVIFYRGEKHV